MNKLKFRIVEDSGKNCILLDTDSPVFLDLLFNHVEVPRYKFKKILWHCNKIRDKDKINAIMVIREKDK
jgi:hypothetical protein